MKLTSIVCKSKKSPKYALKKFTNYTYMPQDREYWPMTLKDKVTRNINRQTRVFCLGEMSVLLSCLKKYEFNESQCSKEIADFYKCQETFEADMKQRKAEERAGIVKVTNGRAPLQLVNKLLPMYPHPKSKS